MNEPLAAPTNAIVLFSGGQDSTTCLAWALERYAVVETVAFDYRQRHRIELDQRLVVLSELRNRFPRWSERLGADHAIDLGVLGDISETSLTRDMSFEIAKSGLPNSFVPGRNLLFLTFAAAIAWRRGIGTIVGGMCETDYSGYPDCRNDTMQAMQRALTLGIGKDLTIETPLMWIDKAATWKLAESLGGAALVDLIRTHTHTCYKAERGPRNEWGHGCGTCPACALRARGYATYRSG